jgi:hypothetical protein
MEFQAAVTLLNASLMFYFIISITETLFPTNNDGPSGSGMHISCNSEAPCNFNAGVNKKNMDVLQLKQFIVTCCNNGQATTEYCHNCTVLFLPIAAVTSKISSILS